MTTPTGNTSLRSVFTEGAKQMRMAEGVIASRLTSDVVLSALVSCGVTLLCGYTFCNTNRKGGLTVRTRNGKDATDSGEVEVTNGTDTGLSNNHTAMANANATSLDRGHMSNEHNETHTSHAANGLSFHRAEKVDQNEQTHRNQDAQTVLTTYQKSGSALYEGDVHAQQYMEFHFTPSRVSFVHRMRIINEAYDFPTRLARKFHSYLRSSSSASLLSSATNGSLSQLHSDRYSNHDSQSSHNANAVHRLRGLDIGCATGVSVFEMSKVFDGGVIGIDRSATFVRIANEARQHGLNHTPMTFQAPVQGELFEIREEAPLEGAMFERCEFYEADCMHILPAESDDTSAVAAQDGVSKPLMHSAVDKSARGMIQHRRHNSKERNIHTSSDAGDGSNSVMEADISSRYWRAAPGETFDGILCLNLIDRVSQPSKLLDILAQLLRKGGILILADPYSWSTTMTEVSEWIGGKNGVRSEDALKEALTARQFQLLTESDEAFLMRNHVRHYQLGFSHCTIWRKQ